MLSANDVELRIRQGPERARVAGGKEKDRKPVDPPPIVQLRVKENIDPGQNYLQSPYLIMVVALYEAHQDQSPPGSPDQLITGTLVSSLHRLKDVDNTDGAFFVFGDLSVKVEGRYRLCFTLHEINNGSCYSIKEVVSDVFTVFAAKNFPGMSESTFLSRSFGDQGVRLRIRKEARNSMAKRPPPPQMGMPRPDEYAHYYQNIHGMPPHMMPPGPPGMPYGAPPGQHYPGFVDERTKRQRVDYPSDPRDLQYARGYVEPRAPYPPYPGYAAPPPGEAPHGYPGQQYPSPATSPYESPGQHAARMNMPPLGRPNMGPPPPPLHVGHPGGERYAPQLPPVSSFSGPSQYAGSLPPPSTLPPPLSSYSRAMPTSSHSSPFPSLPSPSYPGAGPPPGQGISLPPLQVPPHAGQSMNPSSPHGPPSSAAPGPPSSFDSAVQRVSPPRDYTQHQR